MKKSFSFLLFLIFPALTFSQVLPSFSGSDDKIYDGKIFGIVVENETQKPIEFANIALYKAGGTKPIDGTVTDTKGNFKLKNLKNGKYKVTISFLGFTTQTFDSIDINDKKTTADLGKISIKPGSKMLKEAVIEGEKPMIETQIDKIVYNAEKDLTSKGGNASDVLRKVPMVTVNLDGNVTLQGTQNVRILINNKPSSIMAASVADALKMIPADEIEKVEVITSPSAKYDAEGTGGIINIITKKKNIEGLSGSINAGAGTRSSNLFSNLSYRSGRFGTGLNIGGFGYLSNGEMTTTRVTDSSTLYQSGNNHNLGAGPYVQWTTDFDINSKNNISSSIRVRDFYRSTTSTTENNVSTSAIDFYKLYVADNTATTNGFNYDASLDYKKTFPSPDREFTASAQITQNTSKTDYDVTRDFTVDTLSNQEISANTSINREITFQADYVHPFSKKFTLETGAKNILRDVTSKYNYSLYNLMTNSEINSLPDDEFDYNQTIHAGYALTTLTLKKFGIKTGLRYEGTDVDGYLDQENTSFTSNYENWIPSVTFSYRKAGKYNLKLSYTQRIQRPSMNYLNPYVNRNDPLNITYGNPDLDAEKSHSFEFGYSIFRGFGSINSSVYYRRTDNAIESFRFMDPQNPNVFITTYGNIGKNYSTGLSIGTNVMTNGKLMLSSNLNIYYYKVESNSSMLTLSNDGVNYNINLFGSYKFSDHWGVQAFGNFNGPKYSVQGMTTSFFYYNLSGRRELNNQKGGIGFGLDNFATWYLHLRSEYSGPSFDYNSDNKLFFLGVRISFDYRFGKMEFKNQKKKGIKNDDLKEGEDNGMGMPGGGGK